MTTAEQERDQYHDLAARTKADFENYQKRFQRDLAQERRFAHAPLAADLLGNLLIEQKDIAGAQTAYQTAIDSDHPLWASAARVDLAMLLLKKGDRESARNLLERAELSKNPEVANAARQALTELHPDHTRPTEEL